MNINIYFNEVKSDRKSDIRSFWYRYCNVFSSETKKVEIFSSHRLSLKEVESLGKLYFDNDPILQKGYINLMVDKYIIDNYK